MDAKDTWPVVKFIVAATGFKKQDARKLLEEISEKHYSQLYLKSRAWERDTSAQATKALEEVVGPETLGTLAEATRRSITPSHLQDGDDEPGPTRQGASGHGSVAKTRARTRKKA